MDLKDNKRGAVHSKSIRDTSKTQLIYFYRKLKSIYNEKAFILFQNISNSKFREEASKLPHISVPKWSANQVPDLLYNSALQMNLAINQIINVLQINGIRGTLTKDVIFHINNN